MKIKKLDIIGFKSFADTLTVQFPEGICAVVGPNGCGKSNIIDAIRWVMGEQSVKQLRGQAMEDVIFSGSEKKGALNVAEVALTLTNDNGNTPEEYRHFSEIMVSRRLFRSGESGYFINKQPCRLKDVQNLFMGTGVGTRTYAIIEQGRISSLIDAGPEERRFFVEEAAGITRYKSRKREAILKIQRTEQNLLRINDVIAEVKRQMNGLKRQARKAERYKAYQKQIEELETALATYQYKTICAEIEETRILLESLRETDFKHEAELAKLDAAIEQAKHDRAIKHQRISDEKAQRYSLQRTIDKLEADIEHLKGDLNRLTGVMDQLRAEVAEIAQKGEETAKECRGLEERQAAIQEKVQQTKEALAQKTEAEKTARQRLEELNQSLEAHKAELVNLASRKASYENAVDNAAHQRSNLAKRLDQLTKEKKHTESQLDQLSKEVTRIEAQYHTVQDDLKKISETLEALERQLEESRQALSHQVRKVHEKEIERQKLRVEHRALEKMNENYEWFRKGVRVTLTEWKEERLKEAQICGLIADVIEPEPSYEDAVEAALGETLQYVIVREQQGGVAAIDFLQTHSGGRCGFVPSQGVRPLTNSADGGPAANGKDLLINHIEIKEGYEALIRALLGHVIVAENLEAATRLWTENGMQHAVVTKKGDQVCLQGMLTGGSTEDIEPGILAKRRDMKDLASQVSTLETEAEAAKARQKELETEVVSLETELQKARQANKQQSERQVELEKELYGLREKIKHTHSHLEILELETQQTSGEQGDVEHEIRKHQEVLQGLARSVEDKESWIQETSGKAKEVAENIRSLSERVVEFKLELTSLQAEGENTENTLRRLMEFQRDRQERLAQLQRELKQAKEDSMSTEQRLTADQTRLHELYVDLKAVDERLAQSEADFLTLEGTLQQNDQALSEVRTRQQETARKIQQIELGQSERRMERNHLVGRMQERYHQDISTLAQVFDPEGFSQEQTAKSLAARRERIERIGDVNLTAIQDYENLSERYRLLTEQHDDLVAAIDALRRVIRKINRASLKRFVKTFKAVNEKLKTVVPKLFEGGTASLVLTNPRRPLESGVSFLVHPPGKRLTRMSLLSGGEKALAAIALVFSLFLIKPTAFCVLDEIDAPLDEVNTSRFKDMLREIGRESQVLMVTHNKQTMEVADALFGVTMEEKGISKLLSLSLQDGHSEAQVGRKPL